MKNEKTTTETTRVKRMDPDLKMRMEMFNEFARFLRELLNRNVKKPFEIDPMLILNVDFDEPIKLNEFLSKEIFNSDMVMITGVKIRDSVVQIEIRDRHGNVGSEKIYLGQKEDTIKLWEYVLLSLISWYISDLILDKKENLGGFLSDLKEIVDSVKDELSE